MFSDQPDGAGEYPAPSQKDVAQVVENLTSVRDSLDQAISLMGEYVDNGEVFSLRRGMDLYYQICRHHARIISDFERAKVANSIRKGFGTLFQRPSNPS